MTTNALEHGVDVQRTVSLLRRWAHLEEACIRALAAAFMWTPAYELKIELGHQIWAHAERANDLRGRLTELRGGHHEANQEPTVKAAGLALFHSPDTDALLAGWRVILDELASGYDQYLARADASANAQDLRVVRRCRDDLQRTIDQCPPAQSPWADHVRRKLTGAAADEATALPGRRLDRLVFDDRITNSEFESYDNRMTLDFEQMRLAECRIYFNEFYAAGLLASVLLDAWDAPAPWAFRFDMCHHFFDEVRHAQFGMLRLKELGVEPDRVNLTLFDASVSMPFLHRLCYLTLGLEVYFMPRKRPRVRRYAEAGDPRTQLFADVDWSDEGNHVQYGKRWVEFFLTDDARSVEQLQEEIAAHMAAVNDKLPAGQLAPY
ncbi:MAG: hypothetical protein IT445_06060 [Phycisphaeraceae bacterium]|nr:hypothetical protein [Phycisphaeraceae bacterium]